MLGEATTLKKVHFAIEHLLGSPEGWRSLVRELAGGWPDDPASEIVFVLVAATQEIEATFAPGSPSRDVAAHCWRLAALIGVDLYAMESIGMPRKTARDMMRFWKIDPYFRDL